MAAGPAFDRLVAVVERLRGPGGCPWDRRQTHESLSPYVLEEAYEVLAAIAQVTGKPHKLREELGDLLLQVVMHAVIAAEAGRFTVEDVVTGLVDKLIRRHPHVFGGGRAADAGEVARTWQAVKAAEAAAAEAAEAAREGDGKPADPGLTQRLRRVPEGLPPVARAAALQREAAGVGFDWDGPLPALDKVAEEAAELQEALRGGDPRRIEEECGDLLFTLVNVARLAGADPEVALARANAKFVARLEAMERRARAAGHQLRDLDPGALEGLWQAEKDKE
ncbi:MAG TPA: nucleoside triphosphate pyrophosphohydrolase [Bacillota bacterium]